MWTNRRDTAAKAFSQIANAIYSTFLIGRSFPFLIPPAFGLKSVAYAHCAFYNGITRNL